MPNRLAKASSPYLQQHADNPVDWYPWADEAINKARKEDKPILLSIGYSACHWCHVMAEESFADADIAKIMNEKYINIKVDREERPDLDKAYQTAYQVIFGKPGGWPLTVFLTPNDLMPFYAGTYFPRTEKYGIAGIDEVLNKVAEFYQTQRESINKQNQHLKIVFTKIDSRIKQTDEKLTHAPIKSAEQILEQEYDDENHGFGTAPKFPQPITLKFLLQYGKQSQHPEATHMALNTLTKLAQSGIYDQVGGGFFRYSVDEQWMIPHFEKMLYDNAQLLELYADAYQIEQKPIFLCAAFGIIQWLQRDMQDKQGAFYATLDADSDHKEGSYYLWTRDEVKEILEPAEYGFFSHFYGLDQSPNFEDKWHLHSRKNFTESCEELSCDQQQATQWLESANQKLLQQRQTRTLPHRDTKILTSWNALLIKSLIKAGHSFNKPEYITMAFKILDFIKTNLWLDNQLYASYKDGKAMITAYLDDYAFLLDAVITALQYHWRDEDLEFAIQLANKLVHDFQDEMYGGFFFTSHDQEKLVYRPRTLMDEAMPSGNGIASKALWQLGLLLKDQNYLDASERTLKSVWQTFKQQPQVYNSLMITLLNYLDKTEIIILRGEKEDLQPWIEQAQQGYHPLRLCFAIPDNSKGLPKALENYKVKANQVNAYICQGMQCDAPIDDLDEFTKQINNK